VHHAGSAGAYPAQSRFPTEACFWAIEKFVNDSRLANLLKLLVVLICAGAILQRVLPLAGINWF
jgi:hypothetical protein